MVFVIYIVGVVFVLVNMWMKGMEVGGILYDGGVWLLFCCGIFFGEFYLVMFVLYWLVMFECVVVFDGELFLGVYDEIWNVFFVCGVVVLFVVVCECEV